VGWGADKKSEAAAPCSSGPASGRTLDPCHDGIGSKEQPPTHPYDARQLPAMNQRVDAFSTRSKELECHLVDGEQWRQFVLEVHGGRFLWIWRADPMVE
jgi:hypothetical protein